MNNQLTVLIPTSPIPSHPSTAILDETIANIRKYTDAKIIIMFDGVHSSLAHRAEQYRQYMEAAVQKINMGDYGDCSFHAFEAHEHQARMTRKILEEEVNTSLIMFCEHDCSPIGDIPFERICGFVRDQPEINCIRFNIFHQIPDEHQYLMLDKRPWVWTPAQFDVEMANQNITDERSMQIQREYGVRFVRTIQFSARPHIAKTQWYRDILNDFFKPDAKTMIEDVMHSVVQVAYDSIKKDTFGLAIYTPEGNQLRSYHSDARQQDTKIIDG